MTPATRSESLEAGSPLHAYVQVLRKRWWLIAGVAALTVASAVFFTAQQTRVYQAAATVLIDPEPPRVVNIPDVANEREGSQDYYATQFKFYRAGPSSTQ